MAFKALKFVFSAFFLVFLISFVFAQNEVSADSVSSGSSTNSVGVQTQQTQGQNFQNRMPQQFDMGMPQSSFADPEYVAQQKMAESMTTAYNWIAMNSTKFAEGCKNDKVTLTSELASVIQQAQETSSVCARFEAEAKLCNPEIFCSKFSQGNLPLPPNAKIVLKKLGYTPENMKISDFTEDLVVKVCTAQFNAENESRTQLVEAAKVKVKEQIPDFRKRCTEFEKMKSQGFGNIKLPDFGNFPMQQQNMGPQGQQNNYVQQGGNRMPPQGQQMNNQQNNQMGCQGEAKQCNVNERVECIGGSWNCVAGPQGPPQGQCNGEPFDCGQGNKSFCQNGSWACPQMPPQGQQPQVPQGEQQPQPEQPPAQEQPSAPEPEPAPPAPEPAPETPPVQTAASNFLNSITGLVTGVFENDSSKAVCGDGMCSPDFGENPQNCSNDCKAEGFNSQGQQNQVMNNGQGYGSPQGQQVQNSGQGIGGSPEMLCGLTDDELVEMFVGQMGGESSQAEVEYKCRVEASKTILEFNQYKMEIAKCNADAALDCASKQQAVSSCNDVKDNPEKAAGIIVENMCRRFGVKQESSDNKLYQVAEKWYNQDPALANQLGDTVDKTAEDQKALDIVSYVVGNGDYASKLKERAAKLRAVKERLISKGVTDTETLSAIETQANELEDEGNKFGNALDVTRLGYMFR